jgi:hypothetical protein
MVSKPPGCNESERRVASKISTTGSRAAQLTVKAIWAGKIGKCVCTFWRSRKRQHGGKGIVMRLEKPSSSREKYSENDGSITGRHPGSEPEDERVADGFVVVMK